MFEYSECSFTKCFGKRSKEKNVSIVIFCMGKITKHDSPDFGVSGIRRSVNLQPLLQYFSYDYNKAVFMFSECKSINCPFFSNNASYGNNLCEHL